MIIEPTLVNRQLAFSPPLGQYVPWSPHTGLFSQLCFGERKGTNRWVSLKGRCVVERWICCITNSGSSERGYWSILWNSENNYLQMWSEFQSCLPCPLTVWVSYPSLMNSFKSVLSYNMLLWFRRYSSTVIFLLRIRFLINMRLKWKYLLCVFKMRTVPVQLSFSVWFASSSHSVRCPLANTLKG